MAGRRRGMVGVTREFADGKMIVKRGDNIVEEVSSIRLEARIAKIDADLARLVADKAELQEWKDGADASVTE